jgi:hypothetical protein
MLLTEPHRDKKITRSIVPGPTQCGHRIPAKRREKRGKRRRRRNGEGI